jgi:hypothetical protein
VVVGEPFHGVVGVLVHGCWVEGDGLVVCYVAPAFAFASEEFRVEAPGDDGVDDGVVCAVEIVVFWNGEELALAAAGSGAGCLLAYAGSDGGGDLLTGSERSFARRLGLGGLCLRLIR